jgi:hypothetical protein
MNGLVEEIPAESASHHYASARCEEEPASIADTCADRR